MQTDCMMVKEDLRKIRFARGEDGLYNALWGHSLNTKEPFFTNVPEKHPASVGIPEGHIAIERFLTVPVLMEDKLVGQLALANSSRAYTDRDLKAISRITEFYALAIQNKRTDAELKEQMFEINRFNQLMVGREEKMIELKNEINKLLEKEGKSKKYST